MTSRAKELTDKEKVVLRLLRSGHDAKSSAVELGISVHTVNERLRDARRKLGVSSSKEAARILAQSDWGADNPLGYKQFGVGPDGATGAAPGRHKRRTALFWTTGVIIVIASTLAALLLLQGANSPATPAAPVQQVAPAVTTAAEASARAWLALVDAGQWSESWSESAAMFRTQVTADRWAAMVEPIRKPLGALSSRKLIRGQQTQMLPGAPAGDYTMLQFATVLGAETHTIETVTLVREGTAWKVAGYFIKPA